jgi:hypothetical protein
VATKVTRGRGYLAVIACAVLIAGIVASPAGATPQEVGVWTLKETAAGANDEMFGIGAVSENDVWVVGRTNNGFDGATLWSEHWDGAAWSVVPVPQEPDLPYAALTGAAAVSSNDVWAKGIADDGTGPARAILRHWDGTVWSTASAPTASGWALFGGMAFSSSSDVWLVGADSDSPTGRPTAAVLDHWDGVAWSRATLPEALCDGEESFLYDVGVAAPDDAWAVGSCGSSAFFPLVLHWDGQAWTQMEVAGGPGSVEPFFDGVSVVAPDDVWAVGSQNGPEPLIEHWDGIAWTPVSSSSQGDISVLATIAGVSSGDLWAVGYSLGDTLGPLIEHWDGVAWTPVEGVNPFGDNQMLGDIVALPSGVLWTVGYNLFEEMIESDLGDGGFQAADTLGRLGSAQAWHFPLENQNTHSVTDVTGCGLFDSGFRPQNDSFLFPFTAAGTYIARDLRTGSRERVSVPVLAQLHAGKISVRWATKAPAAGFVFDAQVRRPGSTTWAALRTGVTSQAAQYTPTTSGVYGFRARLRNPGVPCASGWSPPVQITT